MKQKDILFIVISTFVLSVLWIGFNIYHKMATSTISADLQISIKPIDPTFDFITVKKLKNREQITPVYELGGPDIAVYNPDTSSNSSTFHMPTIRGQ